MAKKIVRPYKHRPLWVQLLTHALFLLLSVFLLHEVITSFIISTAVVGSRSMEPDIQTGSRIFIRKIPYGMQVPFTDIVLPEFREPAYGDVVLMDLQYARNTHIPLVSDAWEFFMLNRPFPGLDPSDWTHGRVLRRVIAKAGDRVFLSNGQAFVQQGGRGDFIAEHEISGVSYSLLRSDAELMHPDLLRHDFTSSILVGEGQVFVLPDNRAEALGSPAFGLVEIRSVRGKYLSSF